MISEHLKRGGLAALVFAAVALVAAAFWAGDSATARGLARNGETAQAYIVQKHEGIGASGEAVHQVTYAYQSVAADGTRATHRVRHDVPASVFEALAVGRQVVVRYLASGPTVAEVYPGEHADSHTFLDIPALVAAASALAALTGLEFARRGRTPAAQPA